MLAARDSSGVYLGLKLEFSKGERPGKLVARTKVGGSSALLGRASHGECKSRLGIKAFAAERDSGCSRHEEKGQRVTGL